MQHRPPARLRVSVRARGRPWPHRLLFSISGGQCGENLSPFTAMATACKSPWVERNTATAIYSPGPTRDETWRMSEQDGGGHMRAPARDTMALNLNTINNCHCLLYPLLIPICKIGLEVKSEWRKSFIFKKVVQKQLFFGFALNDCLERQTIISCI